eukprot:1115956-Prymnesium_polylepis.1
MRLLDGETDASSRTTINFPVSTPDPVLSRLAFASPWGRCPSPQAAGRAPRPRSTPVYSDPEAKPMQSKTREMATMATMAQS